MKDYYQILGVGRMAKPETILRAFRRLAKKWHPDRNIGNEEASRRLQEIVEAWEVLGDPEKRSRFDRGEDVSGHKPNNTHVAAMETVAQAFRQVLAGAVSTKVDLKGVKFVDVMRKMFQDDLGKLERSKRELESTSATLAGIAERFSVADGENNLLRAITEEQARNLREQAAKAEASYALVKESLAIVESHRFRADATQAMPGWATTNASVPWVRAKRRLG
jgi:DnaJ-class molecular chaperone